MQKKALTLLLISTIVASIAIFPAASAGQQQYQKEYKELKFTVLTPEYDPIRVRIGDLLHMWGEEIGIDITNRPVDFSVEVDLVFTKWDYDMYIIGWGSRVMPWQFGKMFASWSHVPDGDNCEGFSNATYDALTNQSDVTIDREARKEQVFEMQEILAAELPTVGLYHRDMVEAVRAETTGWIFGVWGIDWAKSAESVEFVSGKERTVDGKVQLVAPIMDDMRKENIVDFGGTTWDAYPLDLVFQYLLTMDEKYDPMPYLAKNWSYTEDGLEWTFQLVDNATWHDGEPFTAEDVKFSIDYIMNNSAPWWVGELKYVEEVQIVDTHTVKIVLTEPDAWFLYRISDRVPMVPKHLWKDVAWNITESYDPTTGARVEGPPMVGTGAFKWEERVPGEYVKLVKNPNYWRTGRPKVDEVLFPVITLPASMLLSLKANEIDYMTWYVPPASISDVARDPNLKLFSTAAPSYYYLGFNLQRYPLSERVVRQAIAYMIDKSKIVNELLMGWGTAADWWIAPMYAYWWNEEAASPPHNKTIAAELLDAAGYIDYDGDGIREVPIPYTPGLSAQTDKSSYIGGESVAISGTLLTEAEEPIANETVAIKVTDPTGATILETTTNSTSEGKFSATLTLVKGASRGDYTVQVTAMGIEKSASFTVGAPFIEAYGPWIVTAVVLIVAIVAIAWIRRPRAPPPST